MSSQTACAIGGIFCVRAGRAINERGYCDLCYRVNFWPDGREVGVMEGSTFDMQRARGTTSKLDLAWAEFDAKEKKEKT